MQIDRFMCKGQVHQGQQIRAYSPYTPNDWSKPRYFLEIYYQTNKSNAKYDKMVKNQFSENSFALHKGQNIMLVTTIGKINIKVYLCFNFPILIHFGFLADFKA